MDVDQDDLYVTRLVGLNFEEGYVNYYGTTDTISYDTISYDNVTCVM